MRIGGNGVSVGRSSCLKYGARQVRRDTAQGARTMTAVRGTAVSDLPGCVTATNYTETEITP